MDLRTAEGCKHFVEGLDDVLRDIFYAKKTLPPLAYIFATYDPITQSDLRKVEPVPVCILLENGGELTKDEFSALVKQLSTASKACGVVFASESYVVVDPPIEDAERIRHLANEQRLSEYEGRTEGLVMCIEHQALPGAWIRSAAITRREDPADDFALLGRFETILEPEEGKSQEGRFSHFL